MLEVAKGIWYIHSEGIAHGKLHRVSRHVDIILPQSVHPIIYQENILLESSLESSPRCQITGFVSTGHSDATVTPATISFAAPELFDVVDGDHDVQKKMKIDVYSFGCLYYAVRCIFLDSFGPLSDALMAGRYSLIPYPFTGKLTLKSCGLSKAENFQINWKGRKWMILHGIFSRAVGHRIPGNVRRLKK